MLPSTIPSIYRAGRKVVVACHSGRGRSGTLAAVIAGLLGEAETVGGLVDLIVQMRYVWCLPVLRVSMNGKESRVQAPCPYTQHASINPSMSDHAGRRATGWSRPPSSSPTSAASSASGLLSKAKQ